MTRGVLLDTSFVYALLDRRDQDHTRAAALWKEESLPAYMTGPCLIEVVTLLGKRAGGHVAVKVWRGMNEGAYGTLVSVSPEDEVAGQKLMESYADHVLSFADVTSAAVVRRLDLPKVLTFDSDFKILLPERTIVGLE